LLGTNGVDGAPGAPGKDGVDGQSFFPPIVLSFSDPSNNGLSANTFTIPTEGRLVEIKAWGGGGAGGGSSLSATYGGGGGSGAYQHFYGFLNGGTYTVNVAPGGTAIGAADAADYTYVQDSALNKYVNCGTGDGAANGDGIGAPGGVDGAVYISGFLKQHIAGSYGFNGEDSSKSGGAGGSASGGGGQGGRPTTDVASAGADGPGKPMGGGGGGKSQTFETSAAGYAGGDGYVEVRFSP
jgi:hypothetical protein